MPINNITQTVSTIPAPPHRGVDVQTQFVIKQEDFQDHLQGTTVTELNALKDQLNSRIGEINSTTTTMNGYANTASAGASTATTKAGEASTSASDALASKNQAGTFATISSASATKASQWADNNYNVAVETGKYSAKHWSTVAQNATANKIDKVASTDNAIVRFNGATGEVQDSKVVISDNGYISANGATSGEHVFKPNTTSEWVKLSVTASDYSSLPSWMSTSITQYGSTATGNLIGSIPNANLGALWGQNISNMLIGSNSNSPIIFANGSIERMRIDSNGNVGIGTSVINNKLEVNGSIGFGSTTGNGRIYADVNWGCLLQSDVSSPIEAEFAFLNNAGAALALIDTAGNLLLKSGNGALGYGTGAGGVVTQLTSKSTAVTLNKPTGIIIMNNAALAAGASIAFQFSNSLLTSGDNIYVELSVGISGWYNYRIECAGRVSETVVMLRLTNISGVSLSESQALKFTVIKGANA